MSAYDKIFSVRRINWNLFFNRRRVLIKSEKIVKADQKSKEIRRVLNVILKE